MATLFVLIYYSLPQTKQVPPKWSLQAGYVLPFVAALAVLTYRTAAMATTIAATTLRKPVVTPLTGPRCRCYHLRTPRPAVTHRTTTKGPGGTATTRARQCTLLRTPALVPRPARETACTCLRSRRRLTTSQPTTRLRRSMRPARPRRACITLFPTTTACTRTASTSMPTP